MNKVYGRVIVFDKPDGLGDVIVKGSITNESFGYKEIMPDGTVVKRPCYCYVNHNSDYLVATTANDSLKLEIKEDGVYAEIDLSLCDQGRKMYEKIQNDFHIGASFGFYYDFENVDVIDNIWYIKKIEYIDEITLTHEPAYIDTKVEILENKPNKKINNLKF